MQVWNVLHAARWKCRTRKISKNSTPGHHRTTLSGYIFATEAHIDNRKKNLLSSNICLTCPYNMELRPTSGWDRFVSLGHPSKFQRVSRFGYVTAATSLNGSQPNFALCLAVSWPDTLYMYIHFLDLLPPDGILPRAKFTLCPSMHHRTSFSGYIFATKASIDNRQKIY